MKNLLYKELKLAVHPLCYVFLGIGVLYSFAGVLFGGMSYIWLIAVYSFFFMGVNKGQQSNDLLFTALLPVRKKDIVKARTILIMLAALCMFVLTFLVTATRELIGIGLALEVEDSLFSDNLHTFLATNGFALIGLSAADLLYFVLYYRNGKSLILPALLGCLAFIIFVTIFNIILPACGIFDGLYNSIGAQVIPFVFCVAAYIGLHYLTYRVSSNLLEKVDF